jgi:ankyrin repeat protein
MNSQPNEIICLILGHFNNLNLTIYRRVNKTWKNLIENKILYKEIHPTIEQCIINLDFYHFIKYIACKINSEQKQLIKLMGDPILIEYFEVDYKMIVDKNKLLIKYASDGKIDIVSFLLWCGADIHAKNDDALQWAANNGHTEIVQLLIDNDADIHADEDASLRYSAGNGHIEVVKILLDNNANFNVLDNCPLKSAAEFGHIGVVKLLLENGADLHAYDDYALCMSAAKGHLDVVELLLDEGADIYADGCAPLKSSARYGHLDIVKILLEEARINAKTNKNNMTLEAYINEGDEGIEGYEFLKPRHSILTDCGNALTYAAFNGHFDIVQYLVENGADIHFGNDMALQWSSEKGEIDIVRYLLKKGARIHANDEFALKTAVKNKNIELIKLLLEFGANPHADNNYVLRNSMGEVYRILKEWRDSATCR